MNANNMSSDKRLSDTCDGIVNGTIVNSDTIVNGDDTIMYNHDTIVNGDDIIVNGHECIKG